MIAERPPRSKPAIQLLSVDEFDRDFGHLSNVELVRGRVEETPVPNTLHGRISFQIAKKMDSFAEEHGLGFVSTNDSFVRIPGQPPSVRGADACFYSKQRMPRQKLSNRILDVAPDVVVEVLSPSQTMDELGEKINDYFLANVLSVIIADPDTETISVIHADRKLTVLTLDDVLEIPGSLPGFRLPLRQVFEQ